MWFYDKEIYTTIKTKAKNNLGQIVESYKKDKLFLADAVSYTHLTLPTT